MNWEAFFTVFIIAIALILPIIGSLLAIQSFLMERIGTMPGSLVTFFLFISLMAVVSGLIS